MADRPAVLRRGLWAAVAALSIIVVALAVRAAYEPERATGPSLGEPMGGSFALVDQHGKTVTDDDLRGKPTALFFGYTFCPDVCPVTMAEMTRWMEELGDLADRANYVFVTVDPERDTPEALRDYVAAFSERIVGLSGEPEAVNTMLDSYSVKRTKVEREDGHYTMDHPSWVYFLDAEWRLQGLFPFGGKQEVAVEKLRALIGAEETGA